MYRIPAYDGSVRNIRILNLTQKNFKERKKCLANIFLYFNFDKAILGFGVTIFFLLNFIPYCTGSLGALHPTLEHFKNSF